MENRAPWVTRIDAALERIDLAYEQVHAALGRVRESYREIAEAIEGAIQEARLRHEILTQSQIAEHIGKSTSWVSRTLSWYRSGSSSESPFGDEIAARRAAAKRENEIATSQLAAQLGVNEADTGQLWLFGGSSNYLPGQREATLKALLLLGACQTLTKTAASVRRESLALVRPSDDDKCLFTVDKLSFEIERSIDAGGQVLREVLAVQKRRRGRLQAAE